MAPSFQLTFKRMSQIAESAGKKKFVKHNDKYLPNEQQKIHCEDFKLKILFIKSKHKSIQITDIRN